LKCTLYIVAQIGWLLKCGTIRACCLALVMGNMRRLVVTHEIHDDKVKATHAMYLERHTDKLLLIASKFSL